MRSRRTVSGAAAAVLLLVWAFLLGFGASPASAHAVLEKTSPPDGSTVQTAPASVSLVFDEAPETKFSAIHVTGPDGERKDSGPVTLAGSVVSERLAGSRPAGRYVVDWRVTSDDGHPVTGQFSFTAAAGTSSIAVPGQGVIIEQARSSHTTGIVLGVIAAVVVVGILLGWYAWRRRRTPAPTAHE